MDVEHIYTKARSFSATEFSSWGGDSCVDFLLSTRALEFYRGGWITKGSY
jgi:hypothetical protein